MTTPVPLRVLVVDDEPFARQRLRRLLQQEPGATILGECGSAGEAITRIAADRPDVVFLDIQMPNGGGFGVVRALDPTTAPVVVFVTAHDEHAVEAFEVHALDYLLKPVEEERFHQALERVRLQVSHRDAAFRLARVGAALGIPEDRLAELAPADLASTPGRITIRADGRTILLDIAAIDWLEARGNYVRIHTSGSRYLIRDTIQRLAQRLADAGFVRVHRSAIVNVARIREVQPAPGGDYVVQLAGGLQVRLGRAFRAELMERLGKER